MKMIKSLNDVNMLKASIGGPVELIKKIEQDFFTLYESSNSNLEIGAFNLSQNEAIILLESNDNVLDMIKDNYQLEYVEKYKVGQLQFYRIAKRITQGLEFQLIYSLVGIHDEETEQILNELSYWN